LQGRKSVSAGEEEDIGRAWRMEWQRETASTVADEARIRMYGESVYPAESGIFTKKSAIICSF